MKKFYALLLFAIFCCVRSQAQIVITEIMYNPPEMGTDSLEYIEIYNAGSTAVNLDGWKFSTGITYTFAGTSLPAGGYLVLAVKPNVMQAVLGVQNSIMWDASQGLSNNGEAIVLKDGSGNIMDSVRYDKVAPWPLDANGLGHALTLCDPTKDNLDPANWTSATSAFGVVVNTKEMYGNPGTGCPTGIQLADDNINVPSGKTIAINILANDYIPGTTFGVSISQAAAHGTATLTNNVITYKSTNGYCGNDEVKYKITFGAQTAEATVKLKVYCYPVYTIPQVHGENAVGFADSVNVYCELQGIVYGSNLVAKGLRFGLIDGSNNGILIQNDTMSNFGYSVTEGDKVRCFGQILQVRGVILMELDTILKVSAGNPIVSPLIVDSLTENTESRLVKSSKALTLVDPTKWTTGVGPSGFTVTATDGIAVYTIRIDNDIDLWSAPPPANPFFVTGIGSQFDNLAPLTDSYQIFPRRSSDITEVVATNEPSLASQISMSPNPVFDVLNVRSSVVLDKIEVRDPVGRLILVEKNPSETTNLDLSNTTSGVYFTTFYAGATRWTMRVLKL
jgi:Lamin Tail Domain/Secretion system C-terminal sorting domain/Bacterial Ig domain